MADDAAGRPIQFDIRTPLNAALIEANIARALGRGLPDFDGDDLPVLHVIASGPSAKDAPLATLAHTLAVNGALRLFTDRGLAPTYWAACDPQSLVTRFLDAGVPEATTYLVASKCDASVFMRLANRDVRLWHLDDYAVPGHRQVSVAPSVTLTALQLFLRKGWRRFEVWGWDGCYIDGEHHAGDQGHDPDHDVTIDVDGRVFRTTGPWAAEGHDMRDQLAIFDWIGADVKIHGDGMFAAIRRFVAGK